MGASFTSSRTAITPAPGDQGRRGDEGAGGQDRLTAGLGGQPAQGEQDHQQQLDLRLGDPVADMGDGEPDEPGQQQQGDDGDAG